MADGPSTSSPRPVRPPKQARSRRTLERIARAALELIGERGVEATTVQDIVDRAGSSVGSFYARFQGKEDLLVYLEGRLWDDAIERWEDAMASGVAEDLSLADLVRTIVELVLQAYRVGARQRALLAAHRPDRGAPDPARDFHRALRRGLRQRLLAHSREITHPDPPLAVDVALAVLVGAAAELEADAALREALPALDDERRSLELGRLVVAYLGGDAAGLAGDAARIDFFDVWG